MYEFISIADGNTLLGMNGGQPESPNGERLVYTKKSEGLTSEKTEIWVCSAQLEDHRKIFEVSCLNHNSASATFVDNSKIVFRDQTGGLSSFRIVDVDTGETVYGPIFAKESHCAENGKYPFSISPEFLGKNSGINECGVYMLDIASGDIEKIVSVEKMNELLRESGCKIKGDVTQMSHVQLNPSADAVMMRLSIEESPVFGGLGYINLKTGKTYLMRDKPVHQLWYDSDTYMATRQFYRNGRIECESSYIARFAPDGTELEVLGGIGNHIDGSTDRQYFAGDRCYPGEIPMIYLYKKGHKKPIAEFDMYDSQDTVWKLQVHPNPTFSRDQRRLYFNRITGDGSVSAGFVNIGDIQ